MSTLFGLDLAGIVNDAINAAGGLRPATLIKVYGGSRVPGALSGGTHADMIGYTTQGIFSRETAQDAQTLTRRARGTITLLGKPLEASSVVPGAGDRVAIDGATYEITAVSADPAAATYTCTVTGA